MILRTWRRWICPAWAIFLALVVLGPALKPGYVLINDMVFTPHQSLLPWMFGIGGGLPRSVPQDAIVGLVAGPLPGQVLQKAALFAIVILAGLGCERLLRSAPVSVRIAAITLAIWNPFVAERMIQGHWSLLLAYAAIPWILRAAVDVRSGKPALVRLVLWCALASITPTGGLLAFLIALGPLLAPRAAVRPAKRIGALAWIGALNLAWLVPALLNPRVDTSDPVGAKAFALSSEGFGSLVAALGLRGIWNGAAQLGSRSLPWVVLISLVLVALTAIGFSQLCRRIGRVAGWWLCALAVAGLLVALAGSTNPAMVFVQWSVEHFPGGGLLRDGQKLLAPLAMLIALCTPLGALRLVHGVRSVDGRRFALIVVVLLPLIALPDFAWGAFGRLQSVQYPPGWDTVRSRIASAPNGDAISLPWASFRHYPWNGQRVVLDPAPRYMTTTVVVDDRLPVQTAAGVVLVGGDSPRSGQVNDALASARPLVDILPAIGIGWVIVQTDQPSQPDPSLFVGLVKEYSSDGLALWRVPRQVAAPATSSSALLVWAIDGALLVSVLGAAGYGIATRLRRRKPQ